MPNFPHYGLYFTPEHIQAAHKYASNEPFKSAWAYLDNWQGQNAIDSLIINAFRYRLNDNQSAGEQAVLTLQSGFGFDLDSYPSYFDALAIMIALAQAAELVRNHEAFSPHLNEWLTRYAETVHILRQSPDNIGIVDQVWLGYLNLVSGIVLENEEYFEAGCEVFRQTIAQIRPEGYLPAAVEGGDEASFQREFLVVAALVCMAEAATHAGVDLWNYSSRGISVTTAAAYVTYYYYYPPQWRWGTIPDEPTKQYVKDYGSFLEIVNYHARPQDLKLLLEEQRPLFNPVLGGLTTITHALPARERRGMFG